MIRVICINLWLTLTVAAQAPEILKVDPPSWWAKSSVNPVRLMIRGTNLRGARVQAVGPGVRVVGVAETARGTGTIDALDRALPHEPSDPTLILQADRATDMAVISRVVETVRAAGYTNVLFAVKKK